MMFYTRIACDPPLSQSTIVPHNEDKVQFTILLDTNEESVVRDWEVILWHNCHKDEAWDSLQLNPIQSESQSTPVGETNPHLVLSNNDQLFVKRHVNHQRRQFYFTGSIKRSSQESKVHEFTIKYRRTGKEWIWANTNSSTSNGSIIFQTSTLPKDLSSSFSRFTCTASIKSIKSDVDSTRLWSLEYSIPAASKKSSIQENLIGVPLYVSRWWALVRQWAAWLMPAHGHGAFKVEKDAVVCSFQCRDGLHLVLLGISGVDNVQVVFRDDGLAGVTACARNDNPETKPARVLAAIGYSHETALAACVYAARNLVQRGSFNITGQIYSEPMLKDDLRTNWYSSWSDGIGYCTWNGLGQKLDEQKIFDALKILRENGVQIQTLIIDDNWQTLDQSADDHHYHTWSDFEANKEGFPQGLASTVAEIRQQNPSVKHIAVWHAILGYWGGLTRDGPIAQKYKTKQVKRMDTPKKGFEATTMTIVDADHVQSLYSDFYAFLSSCQVDGVKTDVQMMLDLLEDADDRKELIRAYQDAWILSGLENFQDKMISCMSHFPANFFHGLLPSNRPAVTLRNSDDFFPDILDSHAWHIFVNAHNGLFTQHLNVTPDWDMFQTTNECAAFHAAARCISGGPIYITDEPGKHDFDLIRQMTAETVSGAKVILRPSCIARAVTSSVYISNNEPRLLKIGSYHGRLSTGVAILGVFNCYRGPLLDLVHLNDFRGTLSEQEYMVRSFTSGKVSNPMTPADATSIVAVDLPVRGWDILTAYPVFTWTKDDKSAQVVPLGLVDKMSGAAAILDYTVSPDEGQRFLLSVTLKAMGMLGIYISNLRDKSVEDDFLVMISDSIIPLNAVSIDENVLKIDVETAWKAVDKRPSWSNEIQLDIYMSW